MGRSDFDLEHQNRNVESKIVASLERISQAFRVLLWQESKNFSLTPIQVQIIIFLLHHSDEKKKVSYLADEFNMTKATISDTIKTLEQKSLVSKEYELEDSRSFIIQLTKKGKDVAKSTSMFSEQLKVPIDKLTIDDKEQMLLSLIGIIKHLNKKDIITIQRMCLTCRFYESKGGTHQCNLLNEKLKVSELRIDCPEHMQAMA